MSYVGDVIARVNAESPGLDHRLTELYALLALAKGTDTTLEDVHDAWCLWRSATRPDHSALVPFDQLRPEVQELDREYAEAIHRAAKT